jgi:hypothetical protein
MKRFVLAMFVVCIATSAFALEPVPHEKINLNLPKVNNPTIFSGVNLVLGFGIGSFIQGDWKGGLIGLIGDAAGGTLLYLGAKEAMDIDWTWNKGRIICDNPDDMVPLKNALNKAGAGAIVLGVSRIAQSLLPQMYATSATRKNLESWSLPVAQEQEIESVQDPVIEDVPEIAENENGRSDIFDSSNLELKEIKKN